MAQTINQLEETIRQLQLQVQTLKQIEGDTSSITDDSHSISDFSVSQYSQYSGKDSSNTWWSGHGTSVGHSSVPSMSSHDTLHTASGNSVVSGHHSFHTVPEHLTVKNISPSDPLHTIPPLLPDNTIPPPPLFMSTPKAPNNPFDNPNATFVFNNRQNYNVDLPVLRYEAVKDIYACEQLEIFIRRIETIVDEPARITVSLTQMDHRMARPLEIALLEKYSNPSWENFKKTLFGMFGRKISKEEAWAEVNAFRATPGEDPGEFVLHLVAKYRILERYVPDKLPDMGKLIKQRLYEAQPKHLRSKLNDLVHNENVDYKEFLAEVQKSQKEQHPPDQEVRNVIPKSKADEAKDTEKPAATAEELVKMMQEWFGPKPQGGAAAPNKPRSPYCGYCRVTTHWPSDCPLKPEKGSCFDCLRTNCRKGRPDCPGRSARSTN